MLDVATLDYAGTIAAIVGVVSLVAASFSSIGALNSLCVLIRAKRPDLWENPGPYARLYRDSPPVFRDRWISLAVLGLIRLDLADDDYHALLWTARKRMMILGLILIGILAGVIGFSALHYS